MEGLPNPTEKGEVSFWMLLRRAYLCWVDENVSRSFSQDFLRLMFSGLRGRFLTWSRTDTGTVCRSVMVSSFD